MEGNAMKRLGIIVAALILCFTIQAAANIAQPGDIINVHEGIYRERINPPRGGISNNERIVYRVAKDEKVVIKGSEIIKGWEKIKEDVWKVTIPNTSFIHPDGTAYRLDTDYFGEKRGVENPFPGPFEYLKAGDNKLKIW